MKLIVVTLLVFFLNIPFGYWRANVRKFSIQWVLAIHIPVPVIIALRIFSNLGFAWHTYVFLVAAFFIGQKAGAYIFTQFQEKYDHLSSFLFRDLVVVICKK